MLVPDLHNTEQKLQTDVFRREVKKRSDRLMNYFLIGYFVGGLLLAQYYDTWLVACGVGGLSLIIYYSAKMMLPNSNLYQYVLSAVLAIFMAQYIYQMHGMFEMHFIAFIGSAILITYQNWKLQIPLAALIVLHHGAFGYLQNIGLDNIYFTQLDSLELRTFIIHVVLAAVIFFTCGLWAYQLRKSSEIQIGQSMEMGRLQKQALLTAQEQKRQQELLKAQQELAESHKRFSYATQATSDAIFDRSYSEDTILWGDGFKTLFGYENSKETVSVTFWESKIHPDDADKAIQTILQAKNNPTVNTWKCQYRFLKSDGEYAYVKERAVILRDENGKPARSIGALQDITEIKRNEMALQELNEALANEKYYLDALMDNMPDSIYFKDKDSKLMRVSKYMADKFGVDGSDLIGKSDFDIHDHNHALEAFEDEQQIIKTGVPKIDYIEKETKQDGTERWVSTTKMPLINTRGEVVGTFGISKNVTALKKMEQERHSALLDKAVAQGKFEIASDVMHDIGNAVVGFCSHLNRFRRLQDEDQPGNLENLANFFKEQNTALVNVIGEAKATAVIKILSGMAESKKVAREEMNRSIEEQFNIVAHIQEILNIQRQYIAGHETQDRKPVSLRNIVNDVMAMLLGTIDKTAITVSLNIPADLPPIKGDRTKLMQVILNLVKNSIEAIDKDSSEKSISISAYSSPGQMEVQIKDNGQGFDQSVAGKLFKRGFTTKSSGSGLGLYNCKSIIESHEGMIEISSEGIGKGSVTTIHFKTAMQNLSSAA